MESLIPAFVAEARSWVGVPFRHGGRSRWGVDCVGLVALCLQAVGYTVRDQSGYSREPQRSRLRDAVRAHLGEPVNDEPRAGDVLLMSWRAGSNVPAHVGIVADHPLGGLSLIHAYGEFGQVAEHRFDAHWRSRMIEVYRWHAPL